MFRCINDLPLSFWHYDFTISKHSNSDIVVDSRMYNIVIRTDKGLDNNMELLWGGWL